MNITIDYDNVNDNNNDDDKLQFTYKCEPSCWAVSENYTNDYVYCLNTKKSTESQKMEINYGKWHASLRSSTEKECAVNVEQQGKTSIHSN